MINYFFRGCESILEDVFCSMNKKLHFNEDFTEENITKADVIVMSFAKGETSICHNILQCRKKNSLIVGLYTGVKGSYANELPLCLSGTIFINRNESAAIAKKLITSGLGLLKLEHECEIKRSCQNCQYHTLSHQQIIIAAYIHSGKDMKLITQRLNISRKTVSAYKRSIMFKFNLNSNYELLIFLNRFKKRKYISNLHPELVEHKI